MTKILYLLNYVGKGGTEKYVLDLIQSVGPENCVFVYSEAGPGLDDFIRTNVKMHQVKMTGPFDLSAAKQIKQIIQAERIKVVHAQFLRENYLAIFAKLMGANCKVIWTYHVDVPMGSVIKMLNKMMTSFNTRVITVSKFMFQQLAQKGVAKNKLKLIYNGVPEQKDVYPLTQLHDIPIISVVGRLREEKGQSFLLKGLVELKKRLPNEKWACHIYGDGPQRDELVTLVKENQLEDCVQFKGFCSDKAQLYLSSDIVVIPSSNEALSYVALEALSFARAVIATNVGGLPELIKDKETGLIVDYGDIKGMAEALTSLLIDQALVTRLSEQGKKFFNEHFTIRKMIEETVLLYKE